MGSITQERMSLNDVKSPYSRVDLFRAVSEQVRRDTIETVDANVAEVHPKVSFYSKYGKRMLDILISFLALLVTLPFNLMIGIITFFDVGRPIFFRQERIGKDCKTFSLVKFRNMTNATDKNGNLLPPSERVTKFGYFVRKSSLDELLNFWSIFKGDMSLIGPRPLEAVYLNRYNKRHIQRTAVRPGLECPLIHATEKKITWYEQFENDIYYVENVSFLLDVKMMWSLVKMIFNRKSSAMRGASVRGGFIGYDFNGQTINAMDVPTKYVTAALADLQSEFADTTAATKT